MLINSGIQIHFSDSGDNSSLGITDGVGTYLEGTGEIPVSTNYVNNIFPKKWNGGFSDKFDIRTHVRPQSVGDTTIVLSNARGIFSDLVSNGYNPEGKRVEFVFYTDDVAGEHYPAPSMSVKTLKITSSTATLVLSDITTQQYTELSRPISGDIWEPLVIGDHEKGVFVGTGIVLEDVDTFPWEFIVSDKRDGETAGDIATREIDASYFPVGLPKRRDGYPPSYYTIEEPNLYFIVNSGGGEGSYRLHSIIEIFGDISIQLTTLTVRNLDGTWAMKPLDEEGGITEALTAGVVKSATVRYVGDPHTTSSELYPIYTQGGEQVPYESFVKQSGEIVLGSGLVDGDSVIGKRVIKIDSAEFGGVITKVTPSDGTTGDIVSFAQLPDAPSIDRNKLTSCGSEHDITASFAVGGAVEFKMERSVIIRGDFADAEKALYDIKVNIGGRYTGNDSPIPANIVRRVDIAINYEYIWEDVAPYPHISDPVSTMLYEYGYGAFSAGEGGIACIAKQVVFRSTPAGYYEGDDNDTYTNWNNIVETAVTEPNFDNSTFITGNEELDFQNSFAGQKAPDGIKITVSIVDTLVEVGAGIVSADYQNSIEFFGIGMLSGDVSVSSSEDLYSEVEGRPYTTFKLYQEHLTKLLNWSLNFKTKPSEGWGLAECVDAPYSFLVTNTTPVRSQWTNPSNLTAKKQLEIIQRESWNAMTNTSDGKVWNSFLDKLGAESPAHSYEHRLNCNVKSAIPFDEQDIYSSFVIEYDYDISTKSYNKSISISQTTQESYSADYVSGVTDPTDASNLWAKCNVLSGVVGSEKKFPESLSKLRNIYTEEGAIEFIRNSILLSGVNGGTTYNPSYMVTAVHPVDDLFVSPSMSTIGYTKQGVWGGAEATGVITGRKYIPDPKGVEITSIVKPVFTVSRIIELETNTNRIIELETNTNRIVEVEA